MDLYAEVKRIKYKPLLCKELPELDINEIASKFKKSGNFLLLIDGKNKIACSWWVSAKRTRSYPYARIYDTLNFSGKKISIIPVFKDEGFDGDRDFIQWDTISLMSLLGIYVIISYYNTAVKSVRYENKITNQEFDYIHIKKEIGNLISFQPDALHWNLEQIDKIGYIASKALVSYDKISKISNVKMHSYESANQRVLELQKGKDNFLKLSRELAKKAQSREAITVQPKEQTIGEKSTLTIKNYLGGNYYLTCDETKIFGNNLYIFECKHSAKSIIPSLNDIKDGLIKMILLCNLSKVMVKNKNYTVVPVLKLSSQITSSYDEIPKNKMQIIKNLQNEASENGFQILLEHIKF